MKILQVCPFSTGACGVWARTKQDSEELIKKGHNVLVFSTNLIKGSDGFAQRKERIGNLNILRFPAKKLGGESFMVWNYEKEALEFNPEIIIVHNYRHPHTLKALKIREKIKKKGGSCKVFLITHAPFVEGNITRSLFSKIAVKFYDKFIGPKTINKFDRVITISHWETPFLLNLGLDKNKLEYIPNGIPEEFFKIKRKQGKGIFFFGRISPKKNLETLIDAIQFIKDKKIKVEIIGPKEEGYYKFLLRQIKEKGLSKRIFFPKPIYGLKEKIKKIDSKALFVLPSRVEGMPQALIEVMARGKIVIGSNSMAIRDLINDGKNGYLFEFRNSKDLAKRIDLALTIKNKNLSKNALNGVKDFRISKIVRKMEEIMK